MNPLASPPYSTDDASLASSHTSNVDPAMSSLLASTWQVLETPPPPSLREILSAYKSRGDGDREMLLSMLQAKSAEDQRLASHMSLRKAMIELQYRTQEGDSSSDSAPPQLPYGSPHQHIPQISLPPQQHQPQHVGSSSSRSHRNTYSPPSHQIVYSPPESHARLHESPITSPSLRLPSIRGHASVSSERDRDLDRERERDRDRDRLRGAERERERAVDTRRKRARVGESSTASSYESSRRHNTHYSQQHLSDPRSATSTSLRDLPPSPYSSSSHRSLSTDSTHSQQRGAMAIGTLVSVNGASSSKIPSDESWVRESDREAARLEREREIDADMSEDDEPLPSKSVRRTSRDSLHQHTSSARTHLSCCKPAPNGRS